MSATIPNPSRPATNSGLNSIYSDSYYDQAHRQSHSDTGSWSSLASMLPEPFLKGRTKLVEELTAREIEVMQATLDPDLDLQALANKLAITLATLRTHHTRIFAKLQVETRIQAMYRFVSCYPENLGLMLCYIIPAPAAFSLQN